MKLSNGEIFAASKALDVLLNKELPIKVGYKLLMLDKALADQMTIIEKIRLDLLRKFGKADEKGAIRLQPGSEIWSKFMAEFNEILVQEVEIELEKIGLPIEISIEENIKVEPAILLDLNKYVVIK